jgi:predicted SAM-dependent methyltransferase
MTILELGCGNKKNKDAITVDKYTKYKPDVVHDLNSFPYPFEDETIDQVNLDNVIEHLENPIKVMEELYRITKIGSLVKISVPYFRSVWAYIDPTHKTFYTVDSFAYYDPNHYIFQRYEYTDAKFKVEKIKFN